MIESLSLVERANTGWDKRIRSFTASDLVDLFTITTQRYLVVLDTGNAPEQMQEIIKAVESNLKGRQLLVINSHQHFDHAWGNALFTPEGLYPAPIISHDLSVKLLKENPQDALGFLQEMQATRPYLSNVKIVAPTLTFASTFSIHGGDLTLELFPTPGHSSDHISLWIPEIKTILAADTAEHPIPYAAPDGSIAQLERDLQHLKSFDPSIVLPCHGGTQEPALIDRNLQYFKTLREKIATAPSLESIEPDDAPTHIHWTFEDAMQNLGLSGSTFGDFYHGLHVRNIQSILKEQSAH
jgi:glyoxylase-like metal-dependent hydrolase (beta-lactamase superfamily II)